MSSLTARSLARAYRSSVVAGAICLVLSSAAAVVTAQRYDDATAFRRRAVAATGTVVERRNVFGGALRDDVVVVELPVGGRVVRAEVVVDTIADYRDRSRIAVLHAPEDPERAVLPDLEFPVRGVTLAVVSFLSALVLLGAVGLQAVRLRRASRSPAATEVGVQVGERSRSAYPLLLTAPDGRSLVLPVPRSQLPAVKDRMVARGELRPGGTVYLEAAGAIIHPSAALRSGDASGG